jgi:hypothetical protein
MAAKERMKEQLQEIIPDWLDPQETLGLPIRGKLVGRFIHSQKWLSVVFYQSTAPLLTFIHAFQHLL